MPFCSGCGNSVPVDAGFCAGCGKATHQPPSSSQASAAAAPKLEKVFLESPGVLVTNSRFVVGTQTFAMGGVTSVKPDVDPPSRKGPIITALIGGLMVMGGLTPRGATGTALFGIGLVAIGIFWFLNQKSTHWVILHSASGERKALSSQDGELIAKVIAAITEAIVYRS